MTPIFLSASRADRAAPSRSPAVSREPLSMIARWKSPLALGVASSALILAPPPDSPKMVTLPGSPPKRAMLSRTQRSEATRSSCPTLPESAYFSLNAPR